MRSGRAAHRRGVSQLQATHFKVVRVYYQQNRGAASVQQLLIVGGQALVRKLAHRKRQERAQEKATEAAPATTLAIAPTNPISPKP